MPAVDVLRRRISVTEGQLELLRLYARGHLTQLSDDMAALRSAGLITASDAVHRLVAELLAAMSHPLLEVRIATTSERGSAVSHLVARADELWYTDPWPGADADDDVVFAKDELPQMLWIVARLAGLRRTAQPDAAPPVEATAGTMGSLLAAFSADTGGTWDLARAVAMARADDLLGMRSPQQRERLIGVLGTLEGTWRITCAWGAETRHSRVLEVWDCGPSGFWVRTPQGGLELPEQIDPEATTALVPTSGEGVWRALERLLPSPALAGMRDERPLLPRT